MAKEGFDENGKFAKGNQVARGNKGGHGRPKRSREAKYMAALFRGVPQKRWAGIIDTVVRMAEGGDMSAIRLLFDHLLGKPVTRVITTEVPVSEMNAAFMMTMGRIYGEDGEVPDDS